jgi:predicted small secreted protein
MKEAAMTTFYHDFALHRQDRPIARSRPHLSPARQALAMVLVLGAAGTLLGCNTTRGVGEDVSAAGDALATSAENNRGY